MVAPLLKAQYNRVRTSNALKTNSLWTDAIGLEQEAGTNSAIEATLRAPGGSHGNREERRVRAQELIQASGYQPKVTSYEGLMNLARSQGLANNINRGACKVCGGLGHLTRQCMNGVSGHAGSLDDLEMQAAQAARAAALLNGTVGDGGSSDTSPSSSSSSDSEDERKKRKRSRKDRRERKEKKERKEREERKEKKRRREEPGSEDDEGRRSKPHSKSKSKSKSRSKKDKDKDRHKSKSKS